MAINQGAGWTCSHCGAWVAAGVHHLCDFAPITPRPPLPTDADRIIAAIDRLTAAVEMLAPQEIRIHTVPAGGEAIAKAARAMGIIAD